MPRRMILGFLTLFSSTLSLMAQDTVPERLLPNLPAPQDVSGTIPNSGTPRRAAETLPSTPPAAANNPPNAESSLRIEMPDGDETQQPDRANILLSGPLHEAFAEQFTGQATAGLIVPKRPPEPVDEILPEYRPDGESIAWVPGYWGWDSDREDFVWVTGVWRAIPPNRSWIPGYWAQVAEGYQWISGFWLAANEPEISYLPSPPAPIESGPSSPCPGDTYFWIPGQWQYTENTYQWRAGYWSQSIPGWVWIPERYVFTPNGYIYRAGYWDYLLPDRGTIFCPVYIPITVAKYQFRPTYVLDSASDLLVNLFVVPGCNHYYFGNYYRSRHLGQSIYPWITYQRTTRQFDPLYSYFGTQYRDVAYLQRIERLHQQCALNPQLQPPHSLSMQTQHPSHHDGGGIRFSAIALNNTAINSGNSSHFHRMQDTDLTRLRSGLEPARDMRQQRARFENSFKARDSQMVDASTWSSTMKDALASRLPNQRVASSGAKESADVDTPKRWLIPQVQAGRSSAALLASNNPSLPTNKPSVSANDSNRLSKRDNPNSFGQSQSSFGNVIGSKNGITGDAKTNGSSKLNSQSLPRMEPLRELRNSQANRSMESGVENDRQKMQARSFNLIPPNPSIPPSKLPQSEPDASKNTRPDSARINGSNHQELRRYDTTGQPSLPPNARTFPSAPPNGERTMTPWNNSSKDLRSFPAAPSDPRSNTGRPALKPPTIELGQPQTPNRVFGSDTPSAPLLQNDRLRGGPKTPVPNMRGKSSSWTPNPTSNGQSSMPSSSPSSPRTNLPWRSNTQPSAAPSGKKLETGNRGDSNRNEGRGFRRKDKD